MAHAGASVRAYSCILVRGGDDPVLYACVGNNLDVQSLFLWARA